MPRTCTCKPTKPVYSHPNKPRPKPKLTHRIGNNFIAVVHTIFG